MAKNEKTGKKAGSIAGKPLRDPKSVSPEGDKDDCGFRPNAAPKQA